jgi:hypothetical protein
MLVRHAALSFVLALSSLLFSCSSESSDDDGSDSGGSSGSGRGGSGAAGGTATGGTGGSAGNAPVVDCAAVCERVRSACEGQSTIDDNWVDVCTRACDVRVQVAPESAVLERDCVNAAATCTAAVLCVASPSGAGGAATGGTAGSGGS